MWELNLGGSCEWRGFSMHWVGKVNHSHNPAPPMHSYLPIHQCPQHLTITIFYPHNLPPLKCPFVFTKERFLFSQSNNILALSNSTPTINLLYFQFMYRCKKCNATLSEKLASDLWWLNKRQMENPRIFCSSRNIYCVVFLLFFDLIVDKSSMRELPNFFTRNKRSFLQTFVLTLLKTQKFES